MELNERKLLNLLGAKHTKALLEFINEHGKTTYTDLTSVAGPSTLHTRTIDLLLCGFIVFHSEKKRKWYEITEKGRTVLKYLQDIADLEPEKKEQFLKLLGAKHTKAILGFINEHGKTRHMDMMDSFNPTIITLTLRSLLIFGLIQYTMEKIEKRKEWYEITEKGKTVLQLLDAVVAVGLHDADI